MDSESISLGVSTEWSECVRDRETERVTVRKGRKIKRD